MFILFYLFVLLQAIHPMSSQNKKDSIEFNGAFDRAYSLRNIYPDSAFYWLDKAFEIAQESGKKEWLARAYNLKGVLYYKKNEYFKSITALEKALHYTNDLELKGKIYINFGNTLSDLGYNYSAIHYYKEAVRIFHSLNQQQFLVRALMNLATEEFNIKQVNNARNHLKLALRYAQEYNMVEEEAMCLNNLSAMFIMAGLIDSASRYIYQSFNAYEKIENYFGLTDAYLTAIELHLEKKEWEYAKTLIDIADSLVNAIHYLEGKKLLTGYKINYYLSTSNTEQAAKFFNEYLQLEDSLYKKKLNVSDATPVSRFEQIERKSELIHKNYFSYAQLVIIVFTGIFIFVFILKNYRHERN